MKLSQRRLRPDFRSQIFLMSRGGKTKDRSNGPERRCIVTGESGPKRGMIRFVVGPDETIVPDIVGRLPGRGIWVSSNRTTLRTAIEKNLFAKAARAKVALPDGLFEEVERQLVGRIVNTIALARKAGRAVCGFEKVKSWLAGSARVRVLLQAADGSARGKSKLWTPEGAKFFDCLSAQELGLAFGRQSVIHGALASGGLSKRVVEEAVRLKGLRATDGGKGATGKDKEAK